MQPKSPKQLVIYAVIILLVVVFGLEKFAGVSIFSSSDEPQVAEEVQEEAEPVDIGWVNGAPCEGVAIAVDYEWPHPESEDFENPWECEPQCNDGIQRYISYTNGVGTPCEKVPGCLDIGEDHKVVCVPQ